MVRDTLFTFPRRLCALCLLCTAILSSAAITTTPAKNKKAKPSDIQVSDLRTERMRRPMSIGTATPRLGWMVSTHLNDVMQTSYHLIVASTPEKAEALEGDLWDITVHSDQSQWVRYAGKTLLAGESEHDQRRESMEPYGDVERGIAYRKRLARAMDRARPRHALGRGG